MVLLSFGISTPDKDLHLPEIYWILKLHKDPYIHRCIAGLTKCSFTSLALRFLQKSLQQLEMDFRNIVTRLTYEVP